MRSGFGLGQRLLPTLRLVCAYRRAPQVVDQGEGGSVRRKSIIVVAECRNRYGEAMACGTPTGGASAKRSVALVLALVSAEPTQNGLAHPSA